MGWRHKGDSMKNLLLAVALAMVALPAQALDRADFLGATKLSRTGSAKVIRTPDCRQGERVDALRLVVRNSPAYIEQLGVQYRNGRTEYFRFRQQMPGNSQTRWIDLRGNNGKCVAAVQIVGQSLNLLQKSTVEVYGRVRNNNGGGWPGGNDGWPNDNDRDDRRDRRN